MLNCLLQFALVAGVSPHPWPRSANVYKCKLAEKCSGSCRESRGEPGGDGGVLRMTDVLGCISVCVRNRPAGEEPRTVGCSEGFCWLRTWVWVWGLGSGDSPEWMSDTETMCRDSRRSRLTFVFWPWHRHTPYMYGIYSTVPYICMYTIQYTAWGSRGLPLIGKQPSRTFNSSQLGFIEPQVILRDGDFNIRVYIGGAIKPLLIFGIIKMEVKYHSEGEYVLYGDLFKKPCL